MKAKRSFRAVYIQDKTRTTFSKIEALPCNVQELCQQHETPASLQRLSALPSNIRFIQSTFVQCDLSKCIKLMHKVGGLLETRKPRNYCDKLPGDGLMSTNKSTCRRVQTIPRLLVRVTFTPITSLLTIGCTG